MSSFDRVGLAVVRIQPLHEGHCWIISKMIQECETAIVGVGSADKSCTRSNPLDIETRIQMLRNVFGKRIKIVPLEDLGATPDKDDWVNYVFSKVKALGLPNPTDYYTGSISDSIWYRNKFYSAEYVEECKKTKPMYHSTLYERKCVREGFDEDHQDFNHSHRILHIMDRNSNPIPSATELRSFIELKVPNWKQWVPRVNHELITMNYPKEFLVG